MYPHLRKEMRFFIEPPHLPLFDHPQADDWASWDCTDTLHERGARRCPLTVILLVAFGDPRRPAWVANAKIVSPTALRRRVRSSFERSHGGAAGLLYIASRLVAK